ncbi:MAG: Lrp/AsnC family transcriptional regulator [Deltaproteobacteria bacterium]|jgi:Lrp/AsnC family transcriptional regulator, regulator for asnA, asnC and gidA|nr:Lrp/AsnC family transcriptional regulator [Deltaproteobacteria bacterium]
MTKNKDKVGNKIKELDKTDCKIIQLLQKDGSLSNTFIAKELGIAEATVRTRLKRLIGEAYIKIVAVGDPHKLGFGITGNFKIKMDIKHKDHVIQEISKLKEVIFVNLMTGTMDIDADFIVKSLDELNDLVYNKVSKIDGLVSIETSLIMKQIKEDYAWGTGYDKDLQFS